MNQVTERDYRNQIVDEDEISIDLFELFGLLWSRLHIIILCGLVMALLAFLGTKLLITPKYTSETKVYVLTKSTSDGTVTSSDLQAGTYLTNDYEELVTSRTVMEKVIAQLGLEDIKSSDLAGMISVDTATDSRILTISVENENPKTAQQIADAVRECVSVQITEIMDADSVNTVEVADLPDEPSSPNLVKNIVMGGAIGVFLSIAVIVLLYLLDDSIKTKEDVENYLGLNTLALIPVNEGAPAKKAGLFSRLFGKNKSKKSAKKSKRK